MEERTKGTALAKLQRFVFATSTDRTNLLIRFIRQEIPSDSSPANHACLLFLWAYINQRLHS